MKLLILIALTVLVGLVLVFLLRQRAGRWILGSLLAVLVLVSAFAFILRPRVVGSAALPPPWVPDIQMQLGAETHPSVDEAVDALARRVGDTLAQSLVTAAAPGIVVSGDASPAQKAELIAAIQRYRPGVAWPRFDTAGGELPGALRVEYAYVAKPTTLSALAVSSDGGRLIATVRGGGDGNGVDRSAEGSASSVEVRFREQPWVTDFATFRGRFPGRRLIVGCSTAPATSEQEAIESACAHAAGQVGALLPPAGRGSSADDPAYRPLVLHAVRAGEADRFVQALPRSYGTVYRAAVLVDLSDARMAELTREIATLEGRRQGVRVAGAGSIAVLVLIIFLVYLFLNAVTRGYFTGRLRVAAMVALIAGIMVALLLMG